MSRRTRTLALLTALGAATGALVATASPASAYNIGVDYVDFQPSLDSCNAALAIGCTDGAGDGESNTLTVLPTRHGDTWAFDTIETTSHSNSFAWLSAEIGAQCRRGYHLYDLDLDTGHITPGGGMISAPEEVDVSWPGFDVPIPDARTMPTKRVAMHVPLDALLTGGVPPILAEWESTDDLFARGEAEIDARMASGMTETAARSTPVDVVSAIRFHARVECRGVGGLHYKYYEEVNALLPLSVRFEAIPPPGAGEVFRRPDRVAIPDGVTSATAIVLADLDECVLHVNGVLEADTDLDVSYRLIDTVGQGSQIFHTEIQAGLPTFVSHEVAIPFAGGGLDGPGFVPQPGGGGGTLGDLADHDTDLTQGTFQIEVLSPNHLLSNIDGFSVDRCEPDTVFDPIDVLSGGRRPTH